MLGKPPKMTLAVRPGSYVAETPCNGCTLCCQRDNIFLHPEEGDDPSGYDCESMGEDMNGSTVWRLAHKENGDCIYLDRKAGCTIHERRPAVCRSFDCAALVRRNKRQLSRAIRDGYVRKDVVRRGRELIRNGYRPRLPERE